MLGALAGRGGLRPGGLITRGFPGPERLLTVRPPLSIEPPLLSVDERGRCTVNPTSALVEAFEKDLVASKTYLQEGEGARLAKHLGVTAEIFDQPDRMIPIIRRNWSYGGGSKNGALLFVNQNHYVVLRELGPTDRTEADVKTKEGRRFCFGERTVADGDCLIDGLLILAGQTRGEHQWRKMRYFIHAGATTENTRRILEGILTGLLAGDWPQGLGTNTWKVIDTEPRFRSTCLEVQREKADAERAKHELSLDPDDDLSDSEPGADQPSIDELALQMAIAQSLQPAKAATAETGEKSEPSTPPVATGKPLAKTPPKQAVRAATSVEEQQELLQERTKKPAEGLDERVAQTRKKLLDNGSSTGLPHVFNKIFPALHRGMQLTLERAKPFCKDLGKPTEILEEVNKLQVEFEETYRRHLIANLPPSKGPDENSLAFGSESTGLFFLMDGCFDHLLTLATSSELSKEEQQALQLPYRAALRSVRTQMHHLVVIGIDTAAETHMTKNMNRTDNRRNSELVVGAKAFLQKQTANATGVLIPNFFQTLGEAIHTSNKTPSRKAKGGIKVVPDQTGSSPKSEESGPEPTGKSAASDERRKVREARRGNWLGQAARFAEAIGKQLTDLQEREKKRLEKDHGPNPVERAMEILTGLKKFWDDKDRIAELYDNSREFLGQQANTDKRISDRVYRHAIHGRKAEVLPAEASQTNESKAGGSDFATAQHPVIGGPAHRKVQFSSTNARNVVYNTQLLALDAARKMIGVGPKDRPHARYLIGPRGDKEPKMEPGDVRIEVKRDQNNSNPGEGYVEEYITDDGPMIIAYHTQDCNAKLKIGKNEQAFVPHYHVGTLPGNSIDKEYWKGESPDDRQPQYGTDVSALVLDEPRTAKGQKEYTQHDHDHHLYHL